MTPLDPTVAFKEWAVVCRALVEGVQTVILRKGGIAEEGGNFRPEFDRFWLYPTYFHEPQAGGIRAEYLPLLSAAEADRPTSGMIRLTHVVEVTGVRFVDSLEDALTLHYRHILSEETVRKRFHYREPGLYVLDVSIVPAGSVTITEHSSFAGCKTWVQLTASDNKMGKSS